MVALLRHFLAGSLLLLAVFVSTSDAVPCLKGGICLAGNGFIDKLGKPWKDVYTPIDCPNECYNFFCDRGGSIHAGSGCEESLRKVCPQANDSIINILKVTGMVYNGSEYLFKKCSDDCLKVEGSVKKDNMTILKDKMDPSCTYAEDESNTGNTNDKSATSIHEVSLVLLGWILAGWIFAANLW